MAKRKQTYRKKKHVTPKWDNNRNRLIVYNNKMKIYNKIINKTPAIQHSLDWHNYRKLTIPSSLVRKAINRTDNFMQFYDAHNIYSAGVAIEMVLLNILSDVVDEGKQIFAIEAPYISATPDGFLKCDGTPVEIKTKQKGSIRDLIKQHYHQLQFTIFCSGKDRILLIAYIYNATFDIVEVMRDQVFIDNCIPKLKYAFFTYLFRYDSKFTAEDMNQINIQKSIYDISESNLSSCNEYRVIKNINYKTKLEEYAANFTICKMNDSIWRKTYESFIDGQYVSPLMGSYSTYIEEKDDLHRTEAIDFIFFVAIVFASYNIDSNDIQ